MKVIFDLEGSMGRKRSKTSEMDVAEKQKTPLAKRLSKLITDGNE